MQPRSTLQRNTDGTDRRDSDVGTHGEERETVCDTVWRMAEPSESDLASLSCSADMWRFSLRTLKWDRVQPQPSVSGREHWPEERCGAYYAGGRGSNRLNDRGADEVLLAAGWSGSALGMCETPDAGSNFLPYSLEPRDLAVDGLRSASATSAPWYAIHGEAACYVVTDVWRLDVLSE